MAPTSSSIPEETENEKETPGPGFPGDDLEVDDLTNANEPTMADPLGLDIE